MIIVKLMDHIIHVRITCLSFIRGDIDDGPDHDVINAF